MSNRLDTLAWLLWNIFERKLNLWICQMVSWKLYDSTTKMRPYVSFQNHSFIHAKGDPFWNFILPSALAQSEGSPPFMEIRVSISREFNCSQFFQSLILNWSLVISELVRIKPISWYSKTIRICLTPLTVSFLHDNAPLANEKPSYKPL